MLEAVELNLEAQVRRALEEGADPEDIRLALQRSVELGHSTLVPMLARHCTEPAMRYEGAAPLSRSRRLTVCVGPVTRPIYFGLVLCASREANAARGVCLVRGAHGKLQAIRATSNPVLICGRGPTPRVTLFARCESPAAWKCQSNCDSSCLCVGTQTL